MEKFFFEISCLQEARVVRFAAVNINIYGIPLEKFRIMWIALFWIASNCSVCPLVRLNHSKRLQKKILVSLISVDTEVKNNLCSNITKAKTVSVCHR